MAFATFVNVPRSIYNSVNDAFPELGTTFAVYSDMAGARSYCPPGQNNLPQISFNQPLFSNGRNHVIQLCGDFVSTKSIGDFSNYAPIAVIDRLRDVYKVDPSEGWVYVCEGPSLVIWADTPAILHEKVKCMYKFVVSPARPQPFLSALYMSEEELLDEVPVPGLKSNLSADSLWLPMPSKSITHAVPSLKPDFTEAYRDHASPASSSSSSADTPKSASPAEISPLWFGRELEPAVQDGMTATGISYDGNEAYGVNGNSECNATEESSSFPPSYSLLFSHAPSRVEIPAPASPASSTSTSTSHRKRKSISDDDGDYRYSDAESVSSRSSKTRRSPKRKNAGRKLGGPSSSSARFSTVQLPPQDSIEAREALEVARNKMLLADAQTRKGRDGRYHCACKDKKSFVRSQDLVRHWETACCDVPEEDRPKWPCTRHCTSTFNRRDARDRHLRNTSCGKPGTEAYQNAKKRRLALE